LIPYFCELFSTYIQLPSLDKLFPKAYYLLYQISYILLQNFFIINKTNRVFAICICILFLQFVSPYCCIELDLLLTLNHDARNHEFKKIISDNCNTILLSMIIFRKSRNNNSHEIILSMQLQYTDFLHKSMFVSVCRTFTVSVQPVWPIVLYVKIL